MAAIGAVVSILLLLPIAQVSFAQVDNPPKIEFDGWDDKGNLVFVATDDNKIESVTIVQDEGEPQELKPKKDVNSFTVRVPPPDVGLVGGAFSVYTVTAKDSAGQTKTLNVLVGVVPQGAQEEVEFSYTINKKLTDEQKKQIEDELKKNGGDKGKGGKNPDNLDVTKVDFAAEGDKTKITVKGKLKDHKSAGATFSRFDPTNEDFLIVAEICFISGELPVCPASVPVGGEILAIEMTALLVAGAAANVYWLLPVLAGIVAAISAVFIRIERRN
jgi:hypothetical protein